MIFDGQTLCKEHMIVGNLQEEYIFLPNPFSKINVEHPAVRFQFDFLSYGIPYNQLETTVEGNLNKT